MGDDSLRHCIHILEHAFWRKEIKKQFIKATPWSKVLVGFDQSKAKIADLNLCLSYVDWSRMITRCPKGLYIDAFSEK